MKRNLAFVAALAALLFSGAASAQYVQQSGNVSPGHAPSFVTSGVVQDGGTSSNPFLTSVPTWGAGGCPVSVSSQTNAGVPSAGSQYVQGCLSATNSGVTLSVTPFGGLGTVPFIFDINGTNYAIGGTNWLSAILDSQFGSTQGSILYRSGSVWTALGPGSSGQALQTQGPGQNPLWAATGGVGTVTKVDTGTGLTGGPITSSGTISLSSPVAVSNGGTGSSTLTAHAVIIGEGTNAVGFSAPSTAGTVLTSNGSGADPTFQSAPGTGTVTSVGTNNGLTGGTITTSGTIGLASQNANTMMGNWSGSAGVPTAQAMPSCSATASALIYTSGTGIGCSSNFTANSTAAVGQLPGTTTNDNASAGNVGEYTSANRASGSAISIGSGTNITSLSLTAGDWDVTGVAYFTTATSSVVNTLTGVLATSSGSTAPIDLTAFCQINLADITQPVATLQTCPIGPTRVSLSTTTTVYLNEEAGISSGTSPTGYGIVSARRVR